MDHKCELFSTKPRWDKDFYENSRREHAEQEDPHLQRQ